ncbi:MAG: FAD-dependent oxidoreductase [Phycisphaeraceae bacterium]
MTRSLSIEDQSRLLETHHLHCDVLVAGGGPAGVPCAVAAARCGAKVVLVQNRPVLGGNASSEVRMHIVGADASGKRSGDPATETREGGIIEEIRLEATVRNPQRSASMLDLIFYELCAAEPNLTLLLNTELTGVVMQNQRIARAICDRQSTEDRFLIDAAVFVDCTGDGRLGAEAGADFREGREAKHEFDESLAQDVADNKRLGSTLLFQARKHDRPMPFIPPPWARKFTEDDLKHRPHASRGVDLGREYGYWWLEWGGELDTIKDNEKIRDELLRILMGVWDHVKNSGDHGAENWALEWFGFLPGKRESRRFLGPHILTQHDVQNAPAFHDAIAYGGWPIDPHPPGGVDAVDEKPCTQYQLDHVYEIPLRCCVSRNVANLMFAGRNISATHVGFATTRVMATCAVIGQGVGTAAAHAVQAKREPIALADDARVMRAIQQRLLRDDAYLIGRLNEDEHDLARCATARASSETEDGPASNVLSGQTRSVHGPRGAPTDRAHPGTHRWMSDPAADLPAHLELHWNEPITLGEVQLIFNTGLHRVLTHSHADAYMQRMHWGEAQPETVRDYEVHARVDGQWRRIVAVRGNYQRRQRHPLDEAVAADGLRVTVNATNGVDQARICEVRAYAPGSGA